MLPSIYKVDGDIESSHSLVFFPGLSHYVSVNAAIVTHAEG